MTTDRSDRAETVPRMRDVSHVHPEHDPRGWHWFARGPIIAADGGEPADDRQDADEGGREAGDRGRRRRDVEEEQLRDVSHEPSHGQGANRVWDRGEPDDEDEGG